MEPVTKPTGRQGTADPSLKTLAIKSNNVSLIDFINTLENIRESEIRKFLKHIKNREAFKIHEISSSFMMRIVFKIDDKLKQKPESSKLYEKALRELFLI